jgi:hypothetical protein
MRQVLRLVAMGVTLLLLVTVLAACQSVVRSGGSADVGRRPPEFGEVYPYTDGIEVEITEVWTGHRLGVPVVELTVTIHNGTTHTLEAWIRGELRYGPHRLPALRYINPPGPDDSGSVQSIAVGGSSDPYRLCFVLPPYSRDDVVFHLAFDVGTHDPAVFIGGL